MAKRESTKVRLVICPTCRRLLPETGEFPFYTCGGCETVIQAKYYKRENERQRIASDDPGSGQNGHVFNSRESSSSSQRSSSDELCLSEQDGQIDNGLPRNRHLKQIKDAGSDCEASTSNQHSVERQEPSQLPVERLVNDIAEVNNLEKSESLRHDGSSESSEEPTLLHRRRALQLTSGRAEYPTRRNNDKQFAIRNFVTEASSSNKQTSVESEDSSSQPEGRDENVIESHKQEQITVANADRELTPSTGPVPLERTVSSQVAAANELTDALMDQDELEDAKRTQLEGETSSRNLASGEINCYERHNSVVESISDKESTNTKHQYELTDLVSEELGSISISGEAVQSSLSTSAGPSTGSTDSASIDIAPRGDPLQKIHEAKSGNEHELKHLSSGITQAGRELVNASIQFDGSAEGFHKYPNGGSFAYDGSVSSMDGNDDQILNQNLHLDVHTSKGKYEIEECIGTEDKQDVFLASNMTSTSSEVQHQVNTSAAALPNLKDYCSVKGTMPTMDEQPDGTRNRIQRNTMRRKRTALPSRLPFHVSSGMGYESSSSSNCFHDEYSGHLMHHPPYRYDDPKSSFGGYYPGFEHNGYHPHATARVPHSGETSSSFDHIDHHPLNWHPGGMRWSSQLPPAIYCSDGLHMAPPHHRSCDLRDPYPRSPRGFTDPEAYAWGYCAFSDDQRHRDYTRRKLYLRKKQQVMQRHYRTMAGAAPFVTCYECYELLQLPAEFLLTGSRRRHQLKCGSCSRVLEFSLEDQCHLVPYTPTTILPPNKASDRNRLSVGGDCVINSDTAKQPLDTQKSTLDPETSKNKHERARSSSGRFGQKKATRELPARSSSPLHRLMGYSSASDLLEGRIHS